VIGDYRWGEKSRKLEPAVTVGGEHHGDLDVLVVRIPIKTTSESDLCRPPIPVDADHLWSG